MSEVRQRPNILIIMADDLGWGDVGCYGATRIRTPNIDRLAAEGSRFEDVHAASAVCTPSRYSLVTGRYSWRSPLKKGVLMGHGPALIEPGRPTIASVLKSEGYSTAAIGKWHLGLGWQHRDGTVWSAFREGDPLEYQLGNPLLVHDERDDDFGDDIDYSRPFTGGPTELGFDRFFGISGSLNMPPFAFLSQDATVGLPHLEKTHFLPGQRPGLETPDWDEHEVDLRFTAKAVEFIYEQSVSDDPFLLYFTPSAPHRPQVPPAFLSGVSEAGSRGDSVAFVDWMTGQLLTALEQTGQAEDTIVIFTSDNGAPTIFADDGDTTIHRPNGPWRGQKGDVWDGGHREPFVIRWPGHIPAGAVSSDLFSLMDLLPSLAKIVGHELDPDAAPDGVDVSPLWLGEQAASDRQLVLHSMGGAFCIREGRWKAIFSTGSGGGLSAPAGETVHAGQLEGQLYDVIDDPEEITNLWEERPEIIRDLYGKLIEIVHDEGNGLAFDLAIVS